MSLKYEPTNPQPQTLHPKRKSTHQVRARHNQDYSVRNIQGTVTSLAGNAGQYSVEYTPTWKRNNLSCAGSRPKP